MKSHLFNLVPRSLAVSVAAASLCTSPAFGQAALEEILVTAQKRQESLQEVPIAITVATAAQLQRDQIYSLTDLLRTTPALEVSQSFGGESNGGGRIRGIGTNIFNESSSASVAIVVDQVPQGNTPSDQLFDLAQIEVLRGPQGTLFGQTASAGVINVTTKAPDASEFSATLGADYAWDDFDQTIIRGAVNIPLSENSAIRIAGRFKSEEGLQRNVFLNKDDTADDENFRIRFNTAPSEDLTIDLIAEYGTKDVEGRGFFAPSSAPTNPASLANYAACGLTNFQEDAREYCAERMSAEKREHFGLSAIVDWELENVTLTSVTSYKDKSVESTYLNFSRRVGVAVATNQNLDGEGEQWSQELRISSSNDAGFNYTAGVFFSEYEFTEKPLVAGDFGDPFNQLGFSVCALEASAVPPVPFLQAMFAADGFWCPVPVAFTLEDIEVSSQAVFADVTQELSDKLTLFGGLRYTRQENTFATGVNGPISNSADSEDKEWSGRFGARWFLSNDDMVYASVSRGFKGSIVEISANPAVPANILNPEIATSYEVGTKVTVMDGRIAIDGNVFFTEVDDYQSQVSFFVGTELQSVATNIEKVESKGVEIDIIGAITDNLRVNVGYLYNQVEYPNGYVGGDGSDLSSEQLALAPKQKFTLSGEYFQQVGDNMEAFVNANAYWKDDVRMTDRADKVYVYPSHVSVGGSIGLRSADETWRISLFGRNLTEEAEPVSYLAGDFGGQPDGGIRAWPVAGITVRQIGMSFDYNF